MELDKKKIQRIRKSLGLTWMEIAKRGKLKRRQDAFERYKKGSLRSAEFFGKIFGINPKDLIK
jgi:hypothetical protein